MKKVLNIEGFLVWWLGKLNIQRLKKCSIEEKKVSVDLSAFVPDDGEWHQIALTISYWVKIKKDGQHSEYEEVAVYSGGDVKKKMTSMPTAEKARGVQYPFGFGV